MTPDELIEEVLAKRKAVKKRCSACWGSGTEMEYSPGGMPLWETNCSVCEGYSDNSKEFMVFAANHAETLALMLREALGALEKLDDVGIMRARKALIKIQALAEGEK